MVFHSRVLLPAVFAVTSPSVTQPEDERIFWIIPNYRTSPSLHPYKPLTLEEKFKIAAEDSFDRGSGALAVLFAGEAQLTNSTPAFGQEVKSYARYLGTAYADLVIGDMCDRGHDDGSNLSCYASSRPALLPARDGNRVVAPGKRGRPDLLDSHGFREHTVQLFGDHRQLNCSGDFDSLLSG
jgi:hypothetical protein